MEITREFLYPLGYLANFLFMARFLYQWIYSETTSKSSFPLIFWYFSIAGSITLTVHSIIQLQFPLALVQAANFVLYTRIMQLHRKSSSQPKSNIYAVIMSLLTMQIITSLTYYLRVTLSGEEFALMNSFNNYLNVDIALLSVIGAAGAVLFASRFWLHWWNLETKQQADPAPLFWYLSLSGSLMALIYFSSIFDWVNIIGYGAGSIPYVRNLKLLRKACLK